MSATVLLLDTFNLIRRVYEANPDGASQIQAVVETSCRILEKALALHNPSHAVSVVDSHQPTWRHQLDAGYKAGRAAPPAALMAHLEDVCTAFEALGVKRLMVPNTEADDVIATLATGVARGGGQVIILSTDKSFLPLLTSQVRVYNLFDHQFVGSEDILRRFDLLPLQLPDFWALAGDPTNSIKGVPRVGKKTAVALLRAYADLDGLLAADPVAAASPDSGLNSALVRVQQHADLARHCQQLVTLKTDMSLGVNLRAYRCRGAGGD